MQVQGTWCFMHGHLFDQRDVECLTLSFIRKYYLFVDPVALLVPYPPLLTHFSYLFGNYSVSGAEWSGWGAFVSFMQDAPVQSYRCDGLVGWWVGGERHQHDNIVPAFMSCPSSYHPFINSSHLGHSFTTIQLAFSFSLSHTHSLNQIRCILCCPQCASPDSEDLSFSSLLPPPSLPSRSSSGQGNMWKSPAAAADKEFMLAA